MLQLSAATDKTVTVPYSLDGTALPGDDYTVTPNPVVLLPGDTIAEIQIDIVDDDVDEDAETAVLIMGSPTNAVKGSPSAHIVNIEDNDDPPLVSFTNANQSHREDVDGLAILQLSHPSSRDITVDFNVGGDAQGGVDYSLTSSPITIPAMDTSFPIVIDVVDDLIDEEDELIILTIVGAVNATVDSPDVHTYTIEDNDDPPFVFFTWEKQTGDETVESFTVEVQLSIESSKDITVPFNLGGSATLGADYTIDSNQYDIPPGDLTASIEIKVIADLVDDDVEGDETITLMMGPGPPTNARKGTPFKHTITITSDAMPPSVYFSPGSQTSDDVVSGKLTVKVLLSAAASDPVTVPFSLNGTATRDLDYSIIGNSVTIPAGGAGTTIQVTLYQDAMDEDDETIEINMGVPINAIEGSPSSHTITIIDDDPEPQLYFTTNGQTVDEDAGIVTITAQLDVISGKPVTVPFIVFGSAELGSDKDYTITASPVIIPVETTSVDINLDIIDDDVIELNEDVIITLGTPTNATLASPTTHTVTITDNEPNCPAPTGLPVFGSSTNADVLTWTLQTPSPIVPVNLVEVSIHWPVGAGTDLTGITFGNPLYTGNAAPPFLSVTTPSPLWSGAFDTRDMHFIFAKNPKSVSGDFYQVTATFEGCPPIAGSISSELP
jgi:hypothetical protein